VQNGLLINTKFIPGQISLIIVCSNAKSDTNVCCELIAAVYRRVQEVQLLRSFFNLWSIHARMRNLWT